MGECGCGDFMPYKAFRIGGKVLAVEIYPGCRYCDTGIMVSLHVLDPEEAERWGIDDAKDFEPDRLGLIREDFPLIGKEDIVKWAEEKESELLEYDSLADILEDYGLEMLQDGLSNRLEEVRKNQNT